MTHEMNIVFINLKEIHEVQNMPRNIEWLYTREEIVRLLTTNSYYLLKFKPTFTWEQSPEPG